MKPTPIILFLVGMIVTAVTAVLAWLIWRTYQHDHDVLKERADVDVSLMQQASTLWFVNRAEEADLEAAGIRPQQRALILENRPFRSLSALAEITGIGGGTLRSAIRRGAAAP